ncbi:MAG: DUF4332 domain-containing protein [Planctomycetota bacterium]
MLLDRIEIDAHGPLRRVEIGPLCDHLNAVVTAPGSGKTAISRFIRDSLITRLYPRGMFSSSAGRVVWVDAGGWIHCRREQDGTDKGRRTVQFEARTEHTGAWEGYRHGWFDWRDLSQSAFSPNVEGVLSGGLTEVVGHVGKGTLASETIRSASIPESLADGVVVDTAVTNVARVVAACLQAGVGVGEAAERGPYVNEPAATRYGVSSLHDAGLSHDSRGTEALRRDRQLRAELADVESQLAALDATQSSAQTTSATWSDPEWTRYGVRLDELHRQRASLVRQREDLVSRLRSRGLVWQDHRDEGLHTFAQARASYRANDAALRRLHERADALRRRASDWKRWLAELESPWHYAAERGSLPPAVDPNQPAGGTQPWATDLDWFGLPWPSDLSLASLRERLLPVDAEIAEIRRTLSEVRGLHETYVELDRHFTAPHASIDHGDAYPWSRPWAEGRSWLETRRYHHFVSAIDHYGDHAAWDDFYRGAYRPVHLWDELELRMEAAGRRIEGLLHRIDTSGERFTGVESSTEAAISYRWLRNAASSLAESLHQLRRRLASTNLRDQPIRHGLKDAASQLTTALDHLMAHRERIGYRLRDVAASEADRRFVRDRHYEASVDWDHQRSVAVAELRRVEIELRSVLKEAAAVRRRERTLPLLDPGYPIGLKAAQDNAVHRQRLGRLRGDLETVERELSRLDVDIAQLRDVRSRHASSFDSSPTITASREQLVRRRQDILEELHRSRPVRFDRNVSLRCGGLLAEMASRWVVQLSGGSLHNIDWQAAPTALDPHAIGDDTTDSVDGWPSNDAVAGYRVEVSIDGREERVLPAATRAIAAIAIRLAAGEWLDQSGRRIPLVIETHPELFRSASMRSDTVYSHWTSHGISGNALASGLSDYAAGGRQVLLLTSEDSLADATVRSGGRRFDLRSNPIVHSHQPRWRHGHAADHYRGPHGEAVYPGFSTDGQRPESINMQFEQAWRETAELDSVPLHAAPYEAVVPSFTSVQQPYSGVAGTGPATDHAPADSARRDGYFYAQQTTSDVPSSGVVVSKARTSPVPTSTSASPVALRDEEETPFFLTVDSPIDDAPSIDAVAASRLRRVGVSHITHLMRQDSNRLSDTLGLAGVDAKTIRRWQSECRLLCRVPKLRGFDARVLVGCDITDPAQLAAIHPANLLDRVKTFLATERGQRILLSGTSYELSRITSWIASANQSVRTRGRVVNGRRVGGRTVTDDGLLGVISDDDAFDDIRYEVETGENDDRTRRNRRGRRGSRSNQPNGTASRSSYGIRDAASNSSRTRRGRSSSNTERRSRTGNRDAGQLSRSSRSESSRSTSFGSSSSSRGGGRGKRAWNNGYDSGGSSTSVKADVSTETLRFYLQRSDDVVDAPSIGPRMASRLNDVGVYTVDDLLQSDAASVAETMAHRRVDEDTVVAWQQQATLVCRIPMLRGHDAQFLVAAGMTTAEEVMSANATALFKDVDAIANSNEGKRIARGGSLPDLDEVNQWIHYANQSRELVAA